MNLVPRNVPIPPLTLDPVPGPSVSSTSISSTNIPLATVIEQSISTGTVRIVETVYS